MLERHATRKIFTGRLVLEILVRIVWKEDRIDVPVFDLKRHVILEMNNS